MVTSLALCLEESQSVSMSHREREKLFRTKRPVKEKARCLRTFLHMNISSSSNRTCIMSSPMANEQNDGPFEWQREIILQELDAEASVEGKHNAVMLCLKHRQTDTQTDRQTDIYSHGQGFRNG